MHIVVVGAGIVGVTCAHSLLKHGHQVTLVEGASTPSQGCSFAMNGFIGARSAEMLCTPFKGKAGLASIFAKTRRIGWDVSLGQMRFLRQLAAARAADRWQENKKALVDLARYSVGLTEFISRLDDIPFEQVYGLIRVFTSDVAWEEAHKDPAGWQGGDWLAAEDAAVLEPALKDLPQFLGAFSMPQELSGNGSYFAKQLQNRNAESSNITILYHTKVTALKRDESGKASGVVTDKGDIDADAVVLCNSTGAVPLIEKFMTLPVMKLTGWTVTANTDAMCDTPRHTVEFINKDLLVTRLGSRLRVSGRYWLGEVTEDLAKKIPNELYEEACQLMPHGALWRDSTEWQGETLATPDSLPVVGKTPVEGLYLNIAHGCNGWTLALACGELIAANFSPVALPVDPDKYAMTRFDKKN
jgi:D-amino-acid dehydrogenase